MKRLTLIIILIALGFKGIAQDPDSTKKGQKDTTIGLCCRQTDPSKQPSYIINGNVVDHGFLHFLNPNEIETIEVVKNAASNDHHITNNNGAIIIKMKSHIKWIPLSKILAKNRIKLKDRNLPIYYKNKELKSDSLLATNPRKFNVALQNNNLKRLDTTTVVGKYLVITETNSGSVL